MSSEAGSRPALATLWFRLITLGIVGLVFAEAIFLAKARVQGWTYYLTTLEIVFEVAVRLVVAAVAGVILAMQIGRLLQVFLFDVSPVDPRILVSAIVLLFGAALVTCLIPAKRATRVDPILALKCE